MVGSGLNLFYFERSALGFLVHERHLLALRLRARRRLVVATVAAQILSGDLKLQDIVVWRGPKGA